MSSVTRVAIDETAARLTCQNGQFVLPDCIGRSCRIQSISVASAERIWPRSVAGAA
jgi:hypothetical protein